MENFRNISTESSAATQNSEHKFQVGTPLNESVETSIRKEGISFIFETRFVEAVVQYVYTPIDGTFSDLELEINGTEPFTPSEDGGIIIDYNGKNYFPESEEVERHFISCDLVNDSTVEARWQWVVNGEKSNFLYRFHLEGKSLIAEIEGGGGKSSGISLGRVTGVTNPIIFPLPYFSLGESYPHFLHASGVFISSLLDWNTTNSTELTGVGIEEARDELKLNGGCNYVARSDGTRMALQDRWILTVSDKIEEVIPYLSDQNINTGKLETNLSHNSWLNVSYPNKSEESYVTVYEQLRQLKQYGIDKIFINHPKDTWTDDANPGTFDLNGSPIMGGADALSEYVEGVAELGYGLGLYTSFHSISSTHADWTATKSAIGPDGKPILIEADNYLYKPSTVHTDAKTHVENLIKSFPPAVPMLADHASRIPSDFTDCDSSLKEGTSFRKNLDAQRSLLATINKICPLYADGGNHWIYPGIAHNYYAKMVGVNPSKILPILDFELGNLHRLNVDVGVGDIEQYYQNEIPESEKHSRSLFLNRYIAATLAYGHLGLLPDPINWGIASTIKMHFMLKSVQPFYSQTSVDRITYHKNGSFLSLGDAVVQDACRLGQIKIEYENGTLVIVNLGDSEFTLEDGDKTTIFPPGGYWVEHSHSGSLSYSILDQGNRIDYAKSDNHLYIDTHGVESTIDSATVDGALLIQEKKWEIDVVPIDCVKPVKIDVGSLWPDRKLPPLRIISFNSEDDSTNSFKAVMEGNTVILPPLNNSFKFRIALPEWMVEPGK
jgi:hypothetical protein